MSQFALTESQLTRVVCSAATLPAHTCTNFAKAVLRFLNTAPSTSDSEVERAIGHVLGIRPPPTKGDPHEPHQGISA